MPCIRPCFSYFKHHILEIGKYRHDFFRLILVVIVLAGGRCPGDAGLRRELLVEKHVRQLLLVDAARRPDDWTATEAPRRQFLAQIQI